MSTHGYRVNLDDADHRIVDGEAVIVSASTQCYYALNSTGTCLWQALLDCPGVNVEALALHLGLAPEAVQDFLSQLGAENLIQNCSPCLSSLPAGAPRSPTLAPTMEKFGQLQQLILSGE